MKSSNNTEKTLEVHKILLSRMSVTQIQEQIRDRSSRIKGINELVDLYNRQVRRKSFIMQQKFASDKLKKEASVDFRRSLKYLRRWIERLTLESMIIGVAYMVLTEKQLSNASH